MYIYVYIYIYIYIYIYMYYSSSADLNYHHSINVVNSCPHAATETKHLNLLPRLLCKYINDGYEYC